MSCSVSIQTQRHVPLSDKMLMQSVFRWPIESCVMSEIHSWSLTCFNSWSSITLRIAFCYWFIIYTIKMEVHMRDSDEKSALRLSANPALLRRVEIIKLDPTFTMDVMSYVMWCDVMSEFTLHLCIHACIVLLFDNLYFMFISSYLEVELSSDFSSQIQHLYIGKVPLG